PLHHKGDEFGRLDQRIRRPRHRWAGVLLAVHTGHCGREAAGPPPRRESRALDSHDVLLARFYQARPDRTDSRGTSAERSVARVWGVGSALLPGAQRTTSARIEPRGNRSLGGRVYPPSVA